MLLYPLPTYCVFTRLQYDSMNICSPLQYRVFVYLNYYYIKHKLQVDFFVANTMHYIIYQYINISVVNLLSVGIHFVFADTNIHFLCRLGIFDNPSRLNPTNHGHISCHITITSFILYIVSYYIVES